jgi:polar amino acid transport system substrate-binding protein
MRYLIVAACLLLGSVAQAQGIRLVTEEYPPFGFREGGKYKGSSIDQVEILMKQAGLDYTIDMMPWARIGTGREAAHVLRLHRRS